MKRKIKYNENETFTNKIQNKSNFSQYTERNNLLNSNEYRRNRTSFNEIQLKILQEAFNISMYPDENYRKVLMTQTGLDEDKIIVNILLHLF